MLRLSCRTVSGKSTRCPNRPFFSFLLLLPLVCASACSSPGGNAEETSLSAGLDTAMLHEGDLIFRCGTGIESQAVVAAERGSRYSHVGLLVREPCGWRVLHSVPGEAGDTGGEEVLKKDSLPLFLRSDRAVSVGVYRYDTTEAALAAVCERAMELYGRRVPFDHSYLLSDSSRMYCTEFVTVAFRAIGVDLPEGRCHSFPLAKEQVVYPLDIVRNSHLKELFYISKKK